MGKVDKYPLTPEEIEAVGEEYDKDYKIWWDTHTPRERMDLIDFPEPIEERIARAQVAKMLKVQARERMTGIWPSGIILLEKEEP